MRASVLLALAASACSSESILVLDAPLRLATVLDVSAHGDTTSVTAHAAESPLRLTIADQLDAGALVRVLMYSRSLGDLGLVEGAQTLAPTEELGRALPPADLGVVATTHGGDGWSALEPAEAPNDVFLQYPPIDCANIPVRSVSITDADTGLDLVLATGPDTALLSGRGLTGTVMLELQPDLTLVPRPLPAEVGWLDALASDGAHVWGVDSSSRMHLFDLRGNWLETRERPGIRRVAGSPGGGVFAYGPAGIYSVAPESTEITPIFTIGFPGALRELAAIDATSMIARDAERTYSLRGTAWGTNNIDFGEFTPERITIDDRASYVVTQATLWERPHGTEEWTTAPAQRFVQAVGAVAFGGGRVALHGGGGMLNVRVRPPPESAWCEVRTGTFRFMLEVSVDPSGKTLYALDTRDAGRPPLIIRVELPQ